MEKKIYTIETETGVLSLDMTNCPCVISAARHDWKIPWEGNSRQVQSTLVFQIMAEYIEISRSNASNLPILVSQMVCAIKAGDTAGALGYAEHFARVCEQKGGIDAARVIRRAIESNYGPSEPSDPIAEKLPSEYRNQWVRVVNLDHWNAIAWGPIKPDFSKVVKFPCYVSINGDPKAVITEGTMAEIRRRKANKS